MLTAIFATPALTTDRRSGVLALVQTWIFRARSRRALTKLDADILSDIGWTQAEVLAEANKPFWVA